MDSDQDSADDWVLLDSCTSSSDDDRVLALSSGCTTPASSDDDDTDSEGLYALSDAEDDDASPTLAPPLSGLFHHALARGVLYAPFDPAAAGHHGAKQLVPDPTFSALIHEGAAALASTAGLVCLRGEATGDYYVANPATFRQARLPAPACAHFAFGDPAVVIAFDLDGADSTDPRGSSYRHYNVVVAFPVGDGIYAFESFSSRSWKWSIGAGVVAAENVVAASGVGALGCAFWRTTMGFFLCYEPVSGCSDLAPAPPEVLQWPNWELGEMEGKLCATCMDDPVTAVVVVCLDFARRNANGGVAWTLAAHFEGGCLWGRRGATLLRSQGKAEVVMWDPAAEVVVAMDLEGRTTRTITLIPGSGYYADFIPYIRSLAAVSPSDKGSHAECRTTATNDAGAEYAAMAVDAVAY